MGRQRREFTPEYKDEAVKLVINTGRAVATVARELGINEASLGRWVNAFKARQDAGDGALSETERAELARLRKENSELKLDRAFLKKASRYRKLSVVGGSLARMRVVTYLRVSTGDQVRSGLGLEAQRAALAEAGERDGWGVVAELVDEGISGRVRWAERAALAAAVQLVEAGQADAVAIARLDRLARRTEDALELVRQLGAGLICLNPSIDTTSATGWFGITVLAAAAELESMLASERTRAAMLAKAARGERIGRPRSCPDQVLDQVLELRRGGATLTAIAAELNTASVSTPAGSPRWWPSHVSRLLRTQDARARQLSAPSSADHRTRRFDHDGAMA